MLLLSLVRKMKAWATRLAAILFSITLMQGSLVACCRAIEDLSSGMPYQCHHAPCPSRSCCSSTVVVQAIVSQSLTTSDRLRVIDSDAANLPPAAGAAQSSLPARE